MLDLSEDVKPTPTAYRPPPLPGPFFLDDTTAFKNKNQQRAEKKMRGDMTM
jgi:hypothetical protein